VTTAQLQQIASLIGGLRVSVGDLLGLTDARLAHEMLSGKPHKAGKIVLNVMP
jgi:hypothetical protein